MYKFKCLILVFTLFSHGVLAKDMHARQTMKWSPTVKMSVDAGFYQELFNQCELVGYGGWEKMNEYRGIIAVSNQIHLAERLLPNIVDDVDFEVSLESRISAYYAGASLAEMAFKNTYKHIKGNVTKIMWYCRTDVGVAAEKSVEYQVWMSK